MSDKIILENLTRQVEEAVWYGNHEKSKAYVIDLDNYNNIIEISATIEEKSYESFSTEPHFKINNERADKDRAITKYEKMKNPYVFSKKEYSNLKKLPNPTQRIFLENLSEVEAKMEYIINQDINAEQIKDELTDKKRKLDKLKKENISIDKENDEICYSKEKNKESINKYIKMIPKGTNKLSKSKLVNNIFKIQEKIDIAEEFKSNAVKLEKKNMELTEKLFENLCKKTELSNEIIDLEEKISNLNNEYEIQFNKIKGRNEVLKQKNMLFRMFRIDEEREIYDNLDIEEIEELSEND